MRSDSGMPMILRLQETALNGEVVSADRQGQCWKCRPWLSLDYADKFDFGDQSNRSRSECRDLTEKAVRIWFDKIKFPALPIEEVKKIKAISEKRLSTTTKRLKPSGRSFQSAVLWKRLQLPTTYHFSRLKHRHLLHLAESFLYRRLVLDRLWSRSSTKGIKRGSASTKGQRKKWTAGWSREACIAAGRERERRFPSQDLERVHLRSQSSILVSMALLVCMDL